MSEVDPRGRAVDAGQRQLGKADFISPCNTLIKKKKHTSLVLCTSAYLPLNQFLFSFFFCIFFVSSFLICARVDVEQKRFDNGALENSMSLVSLSHSGV